MIPVLSSQSPASSGSGVVSLPLLAPGDSVPPDLSDVNAVDPPGGSDSDSVFCSAHALHPPVAVEA